MHAGSGGGHIQTDRQTKGEGKLISVIKYVRAFLISSLGAQFVDDFAGPLVQLVEMLALGNAHAASGVAPDTVQARVQVPGTCENGKASRQEGSDLSSSVI